jgi:hypothetical protein
VEQGVAVRDVDPAVIQHRMREQGADPGDIPASNATVDQPEEAVA